MPKAKKDPNKPKGVKSAYIFFVEEQRSEHDQNGEQLSFSDLSKKCGALWADMDDEDKAPFAKLSDKDRKRHQREMESYVPPEADSDSDSEDDRPKKKKKKVKDPNAPKRPITAYFYFAADRRPDIKKENPDYGITQIAQVIGEHWRNLEDEDKHPFEEQAAKDKARYVKEMAVYNKR